MRRLTGLNLDASHVALKMLWLRDEQPTTFERAAGLLLPGSALLAWLTGERLVDHANASSTLLYDITTREWAPEMLEATGLDAGRLGTIADAADVAGTLRAAAAETLGLTTATKVVVGTGDEHSAALGAGGIRPGIVIDITGTAEPVGVAATSPVIDDTGLVETHGHADPRVWLVENPGFVSGGSVAWFTEAFGGGATAAQLDDEAAAGTTAGTNGVTFLPTLSGATAPRWNDRARGVYAGLSLNHGRAHLYRALLEGCTFALRDIVDRLDAMGLVARRDPRRRGRRAQPVVAADEGRRDRAGGPSLTAPASRRRSVPRCWPASPTGTFAGLDEAVERLATLEPRSTSQIDRPAARLRRCLRPISSALRRASSRDSGPRRRSPPPTPGFRHDRARAAPRPDRPRGPARSARGRPDRPPAPDRPGHGPHRLRCPRRISSTMSPRSAETARSSWSIDETPMRRADRNLKPHVARPPQLDVSRPRS